MAGGGLYGFVIWNSWVHIVPCGKVPEGETCKGIETPHRADGSYPGLDWIVSLAGLLDYRLEIEIERRI